MSLSVLYRKFHCIASNFVGSTATKKVCVCGGGGAGALYELQERESAIKKRLKCVAESHWGELSFGLVTLMTINFDGSFSTGQGWGEGAAITCCLV